MSSDQITRRFAILGLIGLGGCGYAPIYGDAEGAAVRGQFSFETDRSVIGYELESRLADRLGVPASPRFVVKVTVSASERAAAITAEGDTARLNIIGKANWSVVDRATGAQLTTGESEAFTSYSATGSTIATQTTRDDARKRLAVILADMISTSILASAGDLPS